MRPSTNKALMSALASELRKRRSELGLTQEDLAGRCELDRPYISLIEVARKQPTLSVLYKLAEALELPFGTFMERIQHRYLAARPADRHC